MQLQIKSPDQFQEETKQEFPLEGSIIAYGKNKGYDHTLYAADSASPYDHIPHRSFSFTFQEKKKGRHRAFSDGVTRTLDALIASPERAPLFLPSRELTSEVLIGYQKKVAWYVHTDKDKNQDQETQDHETQDHVEALNPIIPYNRENEFLRLNSLRKGLSLSLDLYISGSPIEPEMISLYQDKITQSTNLLVEKNKRLTFKVLRLMGMDSESHFQSDGNIGLMKAVGKYDVSRGFTFSTYACRTIAKWIGRAKKAEYKEWQKMNIPYDPKINPSNLTEYKALKKEQNRNDHTLELTQKIKEILSQNAANLSEVEIFTLNKRFFDEENMSFEQIGEHRGFTKQRAEQIQKAALGKVKKVLLDTILI